MSPNVPGLPHSPHLIIVRIWTCTLINDKIPGKGIILNIGLLVWWDNWVSFTCFTPKGRGREERKRESQDGGGEEGKRGTGKEGKEGGDKESASLL